MKDATFSANRLLELYERISDAEDAIPRLRRLVLDLAVRGKLVGQDASDEPAAELLKRIAQEKARLVKAKEIRKLKLVEPISTDEGLDLPASWLQARLGELSVLITKGSTPTSYGHEYTSSGVNFVKVESIVKGVLSVATVSSFISPETHEFLSRSQLATGDILFSIAGTIGTCALVGPEVLPANTNQALAIIRGTGLCFAPDFLITILRSRVADAIQKKARGGAMNNVSLQDIQNVVMPLPPLAEQHRIVAKVDELMALCDQLERARAGREAVRDRLTTASLARLTVPDSDAKTFQSHAHFALQALPTLTTRPDQIKTLRQTILNLAVRGKLVEQDSGDGKAVFHDNVNGGDVPFLIPTNWAWNQFGMLAQMVNGDRSKNYPNRNEYKSSGVAWINTGHIQPDGGLALSAMHYISRKKFESLRSGKIQKGDLLYCLRGATFGKTGFVEPFEEGAIASSLMIIRPNEELDRHFAYFFLTSPFAREQLLRFDNGTAQPNLSAGNVRKYWFPLPPLAEQHRIVAKVDALMTLCDQLEASLKTTATTRRKLLEALLHEALEPVADELVAAE